MCEVSIDSSSGVSAKDDFLCPNRPDELEVPPGRKQIRKIISFCLDLVYKDF